MDQQKILKGIIYSNTHGIFCLRFLSSSYEYNVIRFGRARRMDYIRNSFFFRSLNKPTVVVHIWRPDDDHVGHSALQLSDGTYISWWPKTECDGKHPKAKAAPKTSLREDIESEGKRQPISYKIQITGEELKAITRWWADFKNKENYDFILNNCSTVTYYALKAAFLFLKNLIVPVWVPEAIEMVAQDLEAGKRSIGVQRIQEIQRAAAKEAFRIACSQIKQAGANDVASKRPNQPESWCTMM